MQDKLMESIYANEKLSKRTVYEYKNAVKRMEKLDITYELVIQDPAQVLEIINHPANGISDSYKLTLLTCLKHVSDDDLFIEEFAKLMDKRKTKISNNTLSDSETEMYEQYKEKREEI